MQRSFSVWAQAYDCDSIGGVDAGNTISGNDHGIFLDAVLSSEVHNNKVTGNKVGTNTTGTFSIPNRLGIVLNSDLCYNNYIGGYEPGEGNLISGNQEVGIVLEGPRNFVLGNIIGVSSDGSTSLGNGLHGVFVGGMGVDNTIGGDIKGKNIIGFNGQSGIALSNTTALVNIDLTGNIYFQNGQGIDLGANGRDTNDRGDSDEGPNNFQNYPELLQGASMESGNLYVEFLLDVETSYSTFPLTIKFYKSEGNSQGREYLGSALYTTREIPRGKKSTSASIELPAGSALLPGDFIVATATDADGNTSEFSVQVQVTGNCDVQTWYADVDGDGFGIDSAESNVSSCTKPEGSFVTRSGDCNDSTAEFNPEAEDIPDDGIDQNCDGEDSTTAAPPDSDGDGIGDTEDNCPEINNPDQADANGNGVGDACETATCTGTDILLIDSCTSGSSVFWTVENPGSCGVEIRWEVRKSPEAGYLSLEAGESAQISTSIASRGQSQITLYWKDTTGVEIKLSANASSSPCSTIAASSTKFSEAVEVESTSEQAFPYVYPNPITQEGLYISFPEGLGGRSFIAFIYSFNGAVIQEAIFDVPDEGGDLFWNINGSNTWPSGIYILKLNNMENTSDSYEISLMKD